MEKITNDDKLYERETHIYYNELEPNFELETYSKSMAMRFAKNKKCTITEHKSDIGIIYLITGNKNDLNIDTY